MTNSSPFFPCPPVLFLKHNHITQIPSRVHTHNSHQKTKSAARTFRAAQDNTNGGPRRLIDIIRIIPETTKDYFKKPSRRVLFGGISFLGGFYVAQTVSLSFGALGVNDVISAVLCVLVTEYTTRFYYSRPQLSLSAVLLNVFKLGLMYGLFLDAFKLAS